MPQSRFPPSLNLAGQRPDIPKAGYVRSGTRHTGTEWKFEVLSDDHKVAVATIETADGPVQIGLNRAEATKLQLKLQLFLQDWPKDQLKS
jgi:hypothetical protein